MRPRSWGGWYELTTALVLAAMLLYAVGNSAVPDVLVEAEQRGYSAGLVGGSLLAFLFGLWTRGWYLAGPLAVSNARLQWHLGRRPAARWLRQEMIRTLAVAGVLAAVLAGLALAAAGWRYVVPSIAVWAALMVLVVLAVRLQRHDLDGPAWLVPAAGGATGVTLAAAAAWGEVAAVVIGCVLLIGLVVGQARSPGGAGIRPRLTPRWQLHRGARNRWAAGASVTLMDGEIVRIVRERAAKVIKRPLPGAVYGLPWSLNLCVAVLLRGLRGVAVVICLGLPLAFAVHEILGALPALVIVVLMELLVTVSLSRGAEAWLMSNTLARIWADTGVRVPVALAAPSVVVCGVVAVVISAGLAYPALVAVILVAIPGAVIMRRRSARRNWQRGLTVVATPMGAVSLQSVDKVIAGPDVALVGLLLAGSIL